MSMTEALFLGIDMGTSACRAVAIDGDGVVAGQASVPLEAPRRDGAGVEQQASVWWAALTAAVFHLGEQVPLRRVRAVAVDGTSGTLLIGDTRGNPLTPALMYNDARSTGEAALIDGAAPADSGAHGAASALAKLLYLRRHYDLPDDWRALHQSDWLVARLSGRVGVTDENNALKLGYDPVARCWPHWLAELDIDVRVLPEAVAPGTPLSRIDPGPAKALGLDDRVHVIAGTTDSVAAFIASGAARPGEAVTSLGSTLVLKVISSTPVFAAEFGVYSHRLGDRWLVGGASNTGGAVLRRYFSDDQLAALSRDMHPDVPTGLAYYPLTAPGERFPVNDPSLAPRLTPRTDDPVMFLQGLFEGIAAIEKRGYDRLTQLGAPYPLNMRSVGGGAHNPAWRVIRQRMLGIPFVEPLNLEASYGAALLSRDGYNRMP